MYKKENSLLFNEEKRIRRELNELNGHINNSEKLKEIEFKKLKEVQTEIKKLNEEVKNLKSENDKSNLNFFELRNERNKCNQEVKKLILQIKELRQKYKKFGGSRDLVNPNSILNNIKDFELKIETEGYSFDKEQKVMLKIKDLKREYEGNRELFEIYSEIQLLSKQIEDSRLKADEVHNKFLDMRDKNKNEYDKFFSIIKRINDLRKSERSFFNEYKKHKTNFTANLGLFNNKRRELDNIIRSVEGVKVRKKELKLKKERDIINKKAAIVEDKIKKGLKLTGDDLLVLREVDDVK